MKNFAVIGGGFGDEGKGKVVSYLCSHYPNPLVIRFCGGQQAGHKVVVGHKTHICSNYGAGVLQGVPTYWSQFCTFDPVGLINESSELCTKGITNPILYLDEHCPVTTPFEKIINRYNERDNRHGTCGVGVGQTHQREADNYSLTAYDLQFPWVLQQKLELIRKYSGIEIPYKVYDDFLKDCDTVLSLVKIVDDISYVGTDNKFETLIFEGSQGLLLDQHYGFFPHVTRSNTGMTNILELGFSPEVCLVTRAYQTRHGAGPMSFEGELTVDNLHEYNSDTGIQGKFRIAPLDLTLLKYGVNKDQYIRYNKKTLIVTCLDVVQLPYILVIDGRKKYYDTEQEFLSTIKSYLGIDKMFVSRSPDTSMEWSFSGE